MSWFFPGSLGERQCGRHLGNIHHQELGASSPSSSHTVQAKGSWPLRPNKALLGPHFHAQGLCQLCGQLLLTLLRSDKSLVPHLTPTYRDIGHLHSNKAMSFAYSWQRPDAVLHKDPPMAKESGKSNPWPECHMQAESLLSPVWHFQALQSKFPQFPLLILKTVAD